MLKYKTQTLKPNRAWTDDNGITHPRNWHIWSAEDKAAAGVTEVVQETPPDSRLYTWSYKADGVTISKTAKSFRSAFKSNCAGKGSGDSFSWQGRSYSCARASDKKGYAGEIGKKNPKYASKIGKSKAPPKDYVKK